MILIKSIVNMNIGKSVYKQINTSIEKLVWNKIWLKLRKSLNVSLYKLVWNKLRLFFINIRL
jgi:hypothetical protein